MPSPAMAAGAYRNLARLTEAAGGAPPAGIGPGAGQPAKGGFGAMLQDVVGSVAEAGKLADTRSAQALQGNAELVDVVTAVAESELAIETLVSVRDRVVSAYEEIMRMPI